MSQSPSDATEVTKEHPYAQAAKQLNRLARLGKSFSGHERNCSYLNLGDGKFANLSAVSGMDYFDDGRAIAASDWDFDGDLDFWVANRTGPQVRWLRNEVASENHFVAIRLRGVISNRDAIGATARLYLEGKHTPISKGLRAGEGYLAQGSKWLHFGLGSSGSIDRLEVRWPAGEVEVVQGIEADRYHMIEEGSGVATLWEPPVVAEVEPNAHEKPEVISGVTHHLLDLPAILPPLSYETLDGGNADASQTDGKPRLVNIWATWCRPCLKELKEFTERESDIRTAGLDVLAISVDAISEDKPGDKVDADGVLKNLDFPYLSGHATAGLLEVMQLVNNIIYRDDHRRLPVPTSMLLDRNGNLVAVYKGPVSVGRVLEDLEYVQNTSRSAFTSLPFSGRWIGLPGPHQHAKLVGQLWEQGLEEEAVELVERMPLAEGDDQRATDEKAKALLVISDYLKSSGSADKVAQQLRKLLTANPSNADAHLELGAIVAEKGDLPTAIRHFEQAAKSFSKPRLAVHLNLARAYRQTGKLAEAEAEYKRALSINKRSSNALAGLGMLYAGQARFEEAATVFRYAGIAEPKNIQHRLNLAAAYLQMNQPQDALKASEVARNIDPASISAQVYAAEALSRLDRKEEAIDMLKRVTEQEPKAVKISYRLGELSQEIDDLKNALEYFEKVNSLAKNDPVIQGYISWILATAPDESLRDGKRAVQMAEFAVLKTERKDWKLLDTLAAAYAEQGRFDEAEKVAEEALKVLGDKAEPAQAQAIQSRLVGYRMGRPFRSKVRPRTTDGP